jgi:hypothetical protein
MLGTHKARHDNPYQPPCFDDFPRLQHQPRDRRAPSLVGVHALDVRYNSMKIISSLSLYFAIALSSPIHATPSEDLSSPEQSVRDKAAEVLRVSFQKIPESKWIPLLNKLEKGLTNKEVRAILLPYNVIEGGGAGGGGAYSNSFRLDNEWSISCSFTQKDYILFTRELIHSLNRVDVPKPKDFTGRWVTYFPNGNISCDANYKNGKVTGTDWYDSDGSKSMEEHNHENGVDCEQIGYHPSGKVRYRLHLRDGKQIGILTFYDEAGKVTSTREPPNP